MDKRGPERKWKERKEGWNHAGKERKTKGKGMRENECERRGKISCGKEMNGQEHKRENGHGVQEWSEKKKKKRG